MANKEHPNPSLRQQNSQKYILYSTYQNKMFIYYIYLTFFSQYDVTPRCINLFQTSLLNTRKHYSIISDLMKTVSTKACLRCSAPRCHLHASPTPRQGDFDKASKRTPFCALQKKLNHKRCNIVLFSLNHPSHSFD